VSPGGEHWRVTAAVVVTESNIIENNPSTVGYTGTDSMANLLQMFCARWIFLFEKSLGVLIFI